MSAKLYARTDSFDFRAWCEECKDGYSGSLVAAENWEYLHNEIHHKETTA